MKNKYKISLIVVALFLGLAIVTGISYAYWQITFKQSSSNTVLSDCFEIHFLDQNAITLSNVFPILDKQGNELDPYTFTLTNVCGESARYQINLETMSHSKTKLPDKYLKVNLREGNVSKITTKLDKSTSPNLEACL